MLCGAPEVSTSESACRRNGASTDEAAADVGDPPEKEDRNRFFQGDTYIIMYHILIIDDIKWHLFQNSQGSTLSIWGCYSWNMLRLTMMSWKPRAEERLFGPQPRECPTLGETCTILLFEINKQYARIPPNIPWFMLVFPWTLPLYGPLQGPNLWGSLNRSHGVLIKGVLAKQDLVLAGPRRCAGCCTTVPTWCGLADHPTISKWVADHERP